MYNDDKKPMTQEIWDEIVKIKKRIRELSEKLKPLENQIFKLYTEFAWCESCRHYYETDSKYHTRNIKEYGICNPCSYCYRYSSLENDYFSYDYISQEELDKLKPYLEKQKKIEKKKDLMLQMKKIQDQLNKLEEN